MAAGTDPSRRCQSYNKQIDCTVERRRGTDMTLMRKLSLVLICDSESIIHPPTSRFLQGTGRIVWLVSFRGSFYNLARVERVWKWRLTVVERVVRRKICIDYSTNNCRIVRYYLL